MREKIGIINLEIPPVELLKKWFLLFDRLAFPGFSTFWHKVFGNYVAARDPFLYQNLEWLVEQGFIFEPWKAVHFEELAAQDKKGILDALRIDYDVSHLGVPSESSSSDLMTYDLDVFLNKQDVAPPNYVFSDRSLFYRTEPDWLKAKDVAFLVDGYAEDIKKQFKLESCPVVSNESLPGKSRRDAVVNARVLEVVLRALPTPDASTSWERMMEFKNEADTAYKLNKLGHWMRKVAKADLSAGDIQDELQEYLLDYQRAMELHKLRIYPSTMKLLVVAVPEVLEKLVKLKFSELARGIFSLREREIQLRLEELNLPGARVAYIAKANEYFGKPDAD